MNSNDDQSSQLSSFLKSFGGRNASTNMASSPTQNLLQPKQKQNLMTLPEDNDLDAQIFGDTSESNANQMQLAHMEALIQMKSQQIERLQAEIRVLHRIQNDQAVALEMALQDRRELEKQLAQTQTGIPTLGNAAIPQTEDQKMAKNSKKNRPGSAHFKTSETPYFLENSMFLRAFLRNDQASLDELVKSITSVNDTNTRGLAGQALFSQMQRYMQLNQLFERLFDESGTENLVTTFEQNVRNLLDSRRILLWLVIPSAKVIVSRTASLLVPEGEGLLGKAISEGQRLVLPDPSRDPSYSLDYDGPVISNARVVLYQPVVNTKKEVLWVIQIVDRLSPKGTVVTPSGDDYLILDFLSLSLLRIYQDESRIDEMIKRILTESTRSLLTERQVMPLLETVQLTVTHLVGCESLQIFFADQQKGNLFQLCEGKQQSGSEVNISAITRNDIAVDQAGIAGVAYTQKKTVNVAVANEHPDFNRDIDGEYPNGPCLAVPLLGSKGTVSLVAVARQKKNGLMFTGSDEIILEALSRVSQGALANAQSHERNISEIQLALNNHKYYTALLAVAQELSAVLDTDTLVRKIMTKAQSFIGADRCSLFLVDKERGGLWSMVAHGTSERIHIAEGYGIAGHVAKTGETINIPDAYNDPRFNPSVDKSTGYRTKSILCVPIKSSSGIIIGCTQMINKLGAVEFSRTDVELMTAFNVFCGIALSNAQLYEAATKSKKKMTAMLDIALSLSTSTTLEELITSIISRARELIEAEHCFLFAVDRLHNKLRPLGNVGDEAKEFSIKEDAVGYVALTGSEINIENVENEKRFKDLWPANIKAKQMLVIPVLDASGQVVGIAKAINKTTMPRFTSEDQSLLRAFSSFAGLAFDRFIARQPAEFGLTDIPLIETLSPTELTAVVPSDRLRVFDPLTGIVGSLNFDVYSYPRNELYRFLIHIFTEMGLLSTFTIPIGVALRFFSSIADNYQQLPFHDFANAVSTTQFAFWLMMLNKLYIQFTKIELLSFFVAALCHDLGHSDRITVNAQVQAALDVLYKDQPVNETFHCAALIYLLAQPTCNILENLDSGYVNDFWTLCIDLMLSLDPSQHAKLIEEMDIRLNRGPFDFKDKAAKALLLKLMLKSAVTAEVFRPFDPTKPWTTSVNKLSVVASKGDQKVLLEEMTKYLNETSTPLVRVLLRTMTNVQPLSDQLKLNMNGWKEQLDKLTPAQ
ncbi:GAF domain containing protein [Trichomonas vaginalis G3]|uniref:GAF domain containing protein n=1 Tax=Trichomonas vaginalis (strain ATCC PRA-98 / G3) TaxID=412133 RepID=A2EAR4_TRIV3|nr:3',5'-cyclic-nucleotide phosphodiesterase protein [Trichomonas vaginalis G3]EAY10267.1 GAF domain containing protein [Trichomonas vaginalis G3]KAI5487751.1 3',5'-cyclic-nucleotide phosphodiesterase protein [Trichomonas vaginalis G3]|eukprot:XP_001322490.1 GAF domain containing protein [Trichomonas vaginalis G3]